MSSKSDAPKFEPVIDEKLSNKTMSPACMPWSPEKFMVTSADPLVVLNAFVRVFVDLNWVYIIEYTT